MARNYQISEAVEIIAEGTDAAAIQDIGRRYPLLLAKVAKATSGSNVREVVELFSYMPEYLSANKVNKTMKQVLGGDVPADDTDDGDVEDEVPVKKTQDKKADAKKASDPYAGQDAISLFKECKKRGIKAAPKKTAKYYAGLLKKADAEAAEADDVDDWEDDDDEETSAPTNKKAAAKKATTKKAAKKPEPEDDDDDDDDDDDWDI